MRGLDRCYCPLSVRKVTVVKPELIFGKVAIDPGFVRHDPRASSDVLRDDGFQVLAVHIR